jgi:rhodanese-related sulfurtransferase
MHEIDVATLHGLVTSAGAATPPALVDVREEHEFATGHVPGAVNVPLTELVARVDEVTGLAGPVYLICESGARSGQVTDWLEQQGFAVANVVGGTSAWRRSGYPVDRPAG